MGPCKMVYGVIAGLCLLIPVKKFGGWGRWTASAAGVLGAFAAAWLQLIWERFHVYSGRGQLYCLGRRDGIYLCGAAPPSSSCAEMCYDTLAWKGTQLFEGMIGGSLGIRILF